MESHFNRLTPAQDERLALLLEELAEALQCVGKIQRHGYNSRGLDARNPTNKENLERELGDAMHAITRLCQSGDLSHEAITQAEHMKAVSVVPYLHHQ